MNPNKISRVSSLIKFGYPNVECEVGIVPGRLNPMTSLGTPVSWRDRPFSKTETYSPGPSLYVRTGTRWQTVGTSVSVSDKESLLKVVVVWIEWKVRTRVCRSTLVVHPLRKEVKTKDYQREKALYSLIVKRGLGM